MTRLTGLPGNIPTGTPVQVTLHWEVPYRDPARGATPNILTAQYDWNDGKYKTGGVELSFVHPRPNYPDPALPGALVAAYTIGTGPAAARPRYVLQGHETAVGELDMRVNPTATQVIAAQSLLDIITAAQGIPAQLSQLNTATAAANAAALNANAARVEIEEMLPEARAIVDASADVMAAAAARPDVEAAAALLPDLTDAKTQAAADHTRAVQDQADIAQAQAANDAAVAQAVSDAAAAAGLIPTTATSTTLPNGAGNYRITTGAEAGQVWTRATAGATPTRSAGLETASPLYTRRVTTRNLIADGLNPTTQQSALKWQTSSGYVVPETVTTGGPLGYGYARNPVGAKINATMLPYGTAPLPKVVGTGIKVRLLIKQASGHWFVVTMAERNAGGTITYTNLISHVTPTKKIGTYNGYDVYEASLTWRGDTVDWSLNCAVNYQPSATGQSEFGGLWTVRADEEFADWPRVSPVLDPVYNNLDYLSESQIRAALYTPSTQPVPTAATAPAPAYLYGVGDLAIMGYVRKYMATGDVEFLRSAVPYVNGIISIRDDNRSPQRVDFTGIVRKLWGTDYFQSVTDGVISGSAGTNPPHPGVNQHWQVHTGVICWALLRYAEVVSWIPNISSTAPDINTAATNAKAAALEALHEWDGQFATETHATNTDPSPMLAGEGRWFVKYNSSLPTAQRDGYAYVPGGTELPFNMDCMMAAAVYVAARVTRGTADARSAESAAFLDKADRVMRRLKRSLFQRAGYTGYHYQRQGTWFASGYTNGQAGSPGALGTTAILSISPPPFSGAQFVGEDTSHLMHTLRGIAECVQTTDTPIFTPDDLAGLGRTLTYYWPNWFKQRQDYLETPTKNYPQGANTTPVTNGMEWSLMPLDPRARGTLRQWYAQGMVNREAWAASLRLAGII